MLFCPINDKPQMSVGALPKDSIEKAISEVLGITNISNN
jgi:hypothetical protein